MFTENVKKLLKENMWDLATCSASVPNVVPVVATFKAMVGQMFQGAATAKGALIITPETVSSRRPARRTKRSCNGNFPSLFDPSLFARGGRGTRCAVRARFCTLASWARLRYAVGRKQQKGAIFYAHCSPL